MSSEAPSNVPGSTTSHGTSNKRIRVSTPTVVSDNTHQPPKVTTPVKVALGKVNSFVKTLHPGLASFIENLLQGTIHKYVAYHWKNKKHQSMKDDPA